MRALLLLVVLLAGCAATPPSAETSPVPVAASQFPLDVGAADCRTTVIELQVPPSDAKAVLPRNYTAATFRDPSNPTAAAYAMAAVDMASCSGPNATQEALLSIAIDPPAAGATLGGAPASNAYLLRLASSSDPLRAAAASLGWKVPDSKVQRNDALGLPADWSNTGASDGDGLFFRVSFAHGDPGATVSRNVRFWHDTHRGTVVLDRDVEASSAAGQATACTFGDADELVWLEQANGCRLGAMTVTDDGPASWVEHVRVVASGAP